MPTNLAMRRALAVLVVCVTAAAVRQIQAMTVVVLLV